MGTGRIGENRPMAGVDRGGQTLSATEFAQATGVSRERLRTWERRFGFPDPIRVAGGPRRYAAADVGRVVAVRRAAEDGAPLPAAIAQLDRVDAGAGPPAAAFRATVEAAPVTVALVSGPAPLRLEWANAALRAIDGAPGPGAALPAVGRHRAGAVLRQHFTRELPAAEVEHPPWGGGEGPPSRSLVYRLPVEPGQRPVVAVVGMETRGEREARVALVAAQAELEALRRRGERHDRWLDAIAALAGEFQREPGPDVIGAALDVLVRQTRAVDVGLASYLSGRLALHGSRRGALGACALTVAAHPDVGRALRDAEGVWLAPATAAVLGVPDGLHAAGLPITVAGEHLGLLVLVFDEVEPHDGDNRRLLAAVSAAVGFALLRDRLQRALQATVSAGDEEARTATGRFARPAAGGRRPGG
jgi:MerR family transcriptional regulator, light-induced transcriptional regulator